MINQNREIKFINGNREIKYIATNKNIAIENDFSPRIKVVANKLWKTFYITYSKSDFFIY